MVGMIKGKVSYMSPEQASGTRVDRRSDVFGMGIVLWEAIAGRRLWDGLTDVQIIHALALGKIPRLSDVKPDVDPELADICARALAEVRDLRYGSALELREALVRYLDRLQTRPSQDDVGAFVTKMFAEKREGIRALVEQQLKDLGRGLVALPIVDVEGNGTRSNTPPDGLGSTPVTDSRPARGSAAPTSGPVSAATGGLVASQRPPEDTSVSPMLAGDPTRSRARPFGALALGLAALFGLGLALRYRTASNDVARLPHLVADPGATRLVASADVAPPTAVPTAAAPRVEMRFAAIPPDASLTLDGRTLPSNPYTALVDLDGKPHELRAAATGYIAETRELLFEPHGRVELTLANDPKARGGQGVVKGTKPSSPAGVTAVGGKRAIDKVNPWTD